MASIPPDQDERATVGSVTSAASGAKLSDVIDTEKEKRRPHVDDVVRDSVEATLTGLLEAEGDGPCGADTRRPAGGRTFGRRAGMVLDQGGRNRTRRDRRFYPLPDTALHAAVAPRRQLARYHRGHPSSGRAWAGPRQERGLATPAPPPIRPGSRDGIRRL